MSRKERSIRGVWYRASSSLVGFCFRLLPSYYLSFFLLLFCTYVVVFSLWVGRYIAFFLLLLLLLLLFLLPPLSSPCLLRVRWSRQVREMMG